MPTSRWSSEFGLYRHEDLKRESFATKFIVLVTILGIVLFSVFYLCIFLLKDAAGEDLLQLLNDTVAESEDLLNNTIGTQKFIYTIKDDIPIPTKQTPRPFINDIRGPPPAKFVPKNIDKSASMYPQLHNYGRPGYPRNIQEIIEYISTEMPAKNGFMMKTNKNIMGYTGKFHDPFFPFKPKNPSDINLLATSNLRFAPPVWKDFHPNPVPSQSIQTPMQQEKVRPLVNRAQRTLTLNLNVFPMEGNKQNFYAYQASINPRLLGKRKPRKMIIHLNVFGDYEGANREDVVDEPTDLEVLRELFGIPESPQDIERD